MHVSGNLQISIEPESCAKTGVRVGERRERGRERERERETSNDQMSCISTISLEGGTNTSVAQEVTR
jgi:hypothetical protein